VIDRPAAVSEWNSPSCPITPLADVFRVSSQVAQQAVFMATDSKQRFISWYHRVDLAVAIVVRACTNGVLVCVYERGTEHLCVSVCARVHVRDSYSSHA
jgi:hypothetical protein